MTIAVEGNRTEAVLKALRGEPAVSSLHSTNGRWDIVAELRTDNLGGIRSRPGTDPHAPGDLEYGNESPALDVQGLSDYGNDAPRRFPLINVPRRGAWHGSVRR